ncbi:MAG: SDR family oxidoreductase [Oscillochloridaceae bacterium umkhey_bin13]
MLVVTGPTGNVGSEVTHLLCGGTYPKPYRIAAHSPHKIKACYGDQVPVVPFDYDDRAGWKMVLDGVSTLFLIFPLPTPRTAETRITPFVDAAKRAGAQHIVYLSVPGADREKVIPHYHTERHIEASGIPYTILRASFFMQNLCRGLSTYGVDIIEHNEIFIPAGSDKTTFVDARDVARVALKIFQNPELHRNKAYLLTGRERLDFDAVATIFSEVMGRPIRYRNPSSPHFWLRLGRRGVKWDVIAFMTIIYTLTRTGKNEPLSDEMVQLLDRPPTTMRQFVTENLYRWEQQIWT